MPRLRRKDDGISGGEEWGLFFLLEERGLELSKAAGDGGASWMLGLGVWWLLFSILGLLYYLGFFFAHAAVQRTDPRRGKGTGRQGTSLPPLHPTGTIFVLLSSPRGLNTPQLHPLIDELPIGDRGSGIGSPLPSLDEMFTQERYVHAHIRRARQIDRKDRQQ